MKYKNELKILELLEKIPEIPYLPVIFTFEPEHKTELPDTLITYFKKLNINLEKTEPTDKIRKILGKHNIEPKEIIFKIVGK